MSSVVYICNLALANVGADDIRSLDEASTEARVCKRFYEHARDVLLQSYPWIFAGKTASLGPITNDKPGEWRYGYQKPSDCLKIRYIRDQYSETDYCRQTVQQQIQNPYELEGKNLYCNLSPCFLRYTRRVTDPTLFGPLFIDALAASLSARIAFPITKDMGIRDKAQQLAMSTKSAAEVEDANSMRHSSDHVSEFEEARD
jgi:hypothetical protein